MRVMTDTCESKPAKNGEPIGYYVPHAFMPDFRIAIYTLEHLKELKFIQNAIAESFLEE